jgi:hypothetical protein
MAGEIVVWRPGEPDRMLNDWDGPVGQLIAELSERGAGIARRAVHVWPGTARSTIWNRATSTAVPPGYTRSTIRPHLARGSRTGKIYGGANAAGFPGYFLEADPHGAEQYHDKYPFMSTALDELDL